MDLPSRVLLFTALLATLAWVGCAEPADSPDPMAAESDPQAETDSLNLPATLVGTQWRLVEYQSMDDISAQPPDSIRYTLDLGADGRVAMQLNCNRGTGTWSAEAGPGVESEPEAESGTITFGPMGVTRALCPQPSMDEQIARDMDFVRGYYLRGDTLSLSLMADGGLYRWVPHEGDDA